MKKFKRKTKRLIIRPLEKTDFEAWREAFLTMLPKQNKWDATASFNVENLKKSNFNKIIKKSAQNRKAEEYCDFGVFLKSSGELLGRMGVGHFIRSVTQSALIGYTIYNQHWGHGYSTEAVNAVIDIAFKDYELHRLVAGIEPGNKASIRVVKKLGFRKEGVSKRIVYINDEWTDLLQYALTTEDRKSAKI